MLESRLCSSFALLVSLAAACSGDAKPAAPGTYMLEVPAFKQALVAMIEKLPKGSVDMPTADEFTAGLETSIVLRPDGTGTMEQKGGIGACKIDVKWKLEGTAFSMSGKDLGGNDVEYRGTLTDGLVALDLPAGLPGTTVRATYKKKG